MFSVVCHTQMVDIGPFHIKTICLWNCVPLLHFSSEFWLWVISPPCFHHLPLCHSKVIRPEHFHCKMLPVTSFKWYSSKQTNQSKDGSEWITTMTIVTKICFSLEGKFHKQTWMLYSATGQHLSWIFGCTVAPSSFHLMGLILPLHFAVLSWQGSQSSQHLLLMPQTGGYLLPYMFSLQLHHGRLGAAKRCWRSPLWLVLPASCTIFFIFLDSIREEDSLICLSLVQSVV